MPNGSESQSFCRLNTAYANAAERLHDNGYSPIPLAAKRPRIATWDKLFCDTRPSIDDLTNWSRDSRGGIRFNGIGVATHGGLVIIDIDADDSTIQDRIRRCGIDTASGPACIGRRGIKLFLRSEAGSNLQADNICAAETNGLVEVLAWHRQGVIPPTVHPNTGLPYAWRDPSATLLTTPLDRLPILRADALAGLRHEFVFATDPALLKAAPRLRPDDPRLRCATGQLEFWDGSPAHLDEVASALRAISSRLLQVPSRQLLLPPSAGHTRGTIVDWSNWKWWLIVGQILALWGRLAPAAFDLWVSASRGDERLGLVGCPEKFNMADQIETWDSFHDPYTAVSRAAQNDTRLRTIKSIYWIARAECGWVGSGGQFGSTKVPVGGTTTAPVITAGQATCAKGRGRFLLFRAGLLDHARMNLTPSQATTLADLADHCTFSGAGVGSASTALLMRKWKCPTSAAVLKRIKVLAEIGYIVRSSGRENNASGQKGVSWALTPPSGLSFDDVVRRTWSTTRMPENSVQGDCSIQTGEMAVGCSIRTGQSELSTPGWLLEPQNALASPNSYGHTSLPASLFGGTTPEDRLSWWLSSSSAIPETISRMIADSLAMPKPPLKAMRNLVEVLDRAQKAGLSDGALYEVLSGHQRAAQSPQFTPSRVIGFMRTSVVLAIGPAVPSNAADFGAADRQQREWRQRQEQRAAAAGAPAGENAYARAKDPG